MPALHTFEDDIAATQPMQQQGQPWHDYSNTELVDEVWNENEEERALRVDNVYNEDIPQQQQLPQLRASSRGEQEQTQEWAMQELDNNPNAEEPENVQEPQDKGMTTRELIVLAEQKMREHERNAQYIEAEKCRLQLESLRKRQYTVKRGELESIQREDVKVFFSMVAQHQMDFDRTWQQKTLEHKLRADDLIEALKWKHDQQQKDLYEQLRKKRMPKFSVELLNLRKKQVTLARAKKYLDAERLKKKADVLEAIEIDNIRRTAKQENQMRFKALIKKQQWDRQSLAEKLQVEKQCLLEAKAQDFTRLKKRLRNAEAELKKTHIRQSLAAQRKLVPQFSSHKPRVKSHSDGKRLKPLSRGKKKSGRELAKLGNPGNYDAYEHKTPDKEPQEEQRPPQEIES